MGPILGRTAYLQVPLARCQVQGCIVVLVGRIQRHPSLQQRRHVIWKVLVTSNGPVQQRVACGVLQWCQKQIHVRVILFMEQLGGILV
jgi:hypothetical protein